MNVILIFENLKTLVNVWLWIFKENHRIKMQTKLNDKFTIPHPLWKMKGLLQILTVGTAEQPPACSEMSQSSDWGFEMNSCIWKRNINFLQILWHVIHQITNFTWLTTFQVQILNLFLRRMCLFLLHAVFKSGVNLT